MADLPSLTNRSGNFIPALDQARSSSNTSSDLSSTTRTNSGLVPRFMNRGTKPEFVLVVEDRSDDVLLLERAWSRAGMKLPLRFVNDGKSAIDFLQSQGGNGQ